MSIILGIETSTKICSVALSKGDRILAFKEEGGEYSHSEKLTVFIQEVLAEASLTLADVDAVAVSKGPGSYTGLRIGVSVAKGLCYALSKPLIAVDTLQAMAYGMATLESSELYCPMIDARRMEVYTALFHPDIKMKSPVEAKIITERSFEEVLKTQKVLFFGDGSEKCKDQLGQHQNATFSVQGLPSARYINPLALEKLKQKDLEDVAYFEPYYLKDFVGTKAKKLL